MSADQATGVQSVEQPKTFAFTKENEAKVAGILAKYPADRKRSAVMPLLDLAQRQHGWLPRAAMDHIAERLEMPPVKVLEVATFYTMYNLTPVGEFHVQVCTNITCWLRGAPEVMRAMRDVLGVESGMTADGRATLTEVECLGACVNAPVMQINDDLYEDLTYDTAKAVLVALLNGDEPPKVGSQAGRQTSCSCKGATTLKDRIPKEFHCKVDKTKADKETV